MFLNDICLFHVHLVFCLHICLCEGWELSCGYWEWNSGPLEEQPLLTSPQPSLQPLEKHIETHFQISQLKVQHTQLNNG